jgi:hypothetical protein
MTVPKRRFIVKRTRHLTLQAFSVVLVVLLSLPTGAVAQSNSGLVIQVLEANQGENLIEKELPPLKVRVMDRSGRVIPGADVSFQAPDEGPTGHFVSNNASQITVTTDSKGLATAPPFRTNTRVGEYQINVVASYRDSTSKAVIPQSNVYKGKSSSKKFIILSAVNGGAAAAAFAGGHGGSSGSSAPTAGTLSSPTQSTATPSNGGDFYPHDCRRRAH